MRSIVKLPAAIVDMTEAALYLEEEAGLDIAVRFLDICEEAFQQLAAMPGMGSLRPATGYPDARTWRLNPHPHMVIYQATPSTLVIIRVIHGARDLTAIIGSPAIADEL